MSTNNDELGSLDEIDIDAILNASIGTTGKPDVPSAHEALPSLFEDDIVDIESLLAETLAFDSNNATEFSLADTVELLRPPDNELEALEALNTAAVTEPEPASAFFSDASIMEMEEEIEETAESEEAPVEQPAPPAAPITHTVVAEDMESVAPILLSELLKKESESMHIGPTPIPDLPDALPASSTRKFRTRPKRPLTYRQKRACVYAAGIILWIITTSHMSWNAYQRHLALMQPPVPPVKVAKLIPPKPLPAKPAIAPKKTEANPSTPDKSPDEDASAGLDENPKKAGSENFEPIQCNIQMDSKTFREDIRQCLQMVKMQH